MSNPDFPARHVSVRQLRYFVAVAEHRSFRRAAERLCISQPPITKQIQALEQTLGVALLDRVRRRLSLTAAGEAFYTEARMLLGNLDRVCDTIRAFHLASPRSFVIGMADDFVYSRHLERLLAAAQKRGVRIETTVALSPSLELQVAHGIIDAALVNLPLSSDPAGLVMQSIAPSRLCLLVEKTHPLARLTRVHPAALRDVPLIMCPEVPANAFARQCEKLFVAGGITPTIAHRSTSTAITEVLVERGLGAGIVTEHSVRPHNPRLKCIPFDSEESLYRHAVVHRADRSSSDLLEILSAFEPEDRGKRPRRRGPSSSDALLSRSPAAGNPSARARANG
jgi:DNA-binding transcriptional LysR family regulator